MDEQQGLSAKWHSKDFAQRVTLSPEVRVRTLHWKRSENVSRES